MVNALWENIFRRDSEKQLILKVLRQNILFQDLSKRELNFVHNIIHVRRYKTTETIFTQGEVGVGMYLIVKGSVDILVEDQSAENPEGKETFITRLLDGDFFGELSLVEDTGRRSATAAAHEDSLLIGFFKPDLLEILERNPNVGVKVVFRLAEALGRRLVRTTENITRLKKDVKRLEQKKSVKNEPQEQYTT